MPHIPVAVEDIPEYFTEDDWQDCVTTIRTIGIVRRLEHEFYVIESVDDETESVQIPLSRGTNRQLRVFRTDNWVDDLEEKRKREKKNECDKAEGEGLKSIKNINETNDKVVPKSKIKELPFPDSVQDSSTLGDTRVEDGAVYMVLGKLQWANHEPIIDVHKFIPVHDLEKTYETFELQYAVARRHVDFYKPHFDEIREIVRRPEEKPSPAFIQLMKKLRWNP